MQQSVKVGDLLVNVWYVRLNDSGGICYYFKINTARQGILMVTFNPFVDRIDAECVDETTVLSNVLESEYNVDWVIHESICYNEINLRETHSATLAEFRKAKAEG
jgi:hypothetical protein